MSKLSIVYIGRRWNDDRSKLSFGFLYEGNEVFFSHIKRRLVIGFSYEAELNDDNDLCMYSRPEVVADERKNIPDLRTYEIKDTVAWELRQKHMLEKRMSEKADLLKDIRLFEKYFRGLTYREARVFAEYIVQKVMTKDSKERIRKQFNIGDDDD